MEEKITTGQREQFAAAPEAPRKEAQNSERKTNGKPSKDNEVILAFLRQCGPYEADSIRAVVEYATADGDNPPLRQEDQKSLNRYLNQTVATMGKVDGNTVGEQRLERAFALLDAASRFLEKSQAIKATKFLMRFAMSKTTHRRNGKGECGASKQRQFCQYSNTSQLLTKQRHFAESSWSGRKQRTS